MAKTFDPDKIEQQINSITPEQFGVLVAQVVQTRPDSTYWRLVNTAIEKVTGWSAEHFQVEELVDRIAETYVRGL